MKTTDETEWEPPAGWGTLPRATERSTLRPLTEKELAGHSADEWLEIIKTETDAEYASGNALDTLESPSPQSPNGLKLSDRGWRGQTMDAERACRQPLFAGARG